jgi:uncharacterized protein YndB with AHSA1/START domain
MASTEKAIITLETLVKAPQAKVWQAWTKPEHIIHWNYASEDWHTPWAENDLRKGGKFVCRMEARDGAFGFDFIGVYDEIIENKLIAYSIADGRKVKITFANNGSEIKITEAFEAEDSNPLEMQQSGWQAILNNFKKYAESIP